FTGGDSGSGSGSGVGANGGGSSNGSGGNASGNGGGGGNRGGHDAGGSGGSNDRTEVIGGNGNGNGNGGGGGGGGGGSGASGPTRSGGSGGLIRLQHEEQPSFPSDVSINTLGQLSTFGATNLFGWTRAIVRSFAAGFGTNRTRVQSQGGGFGTGITTTSTYSVAVTQLQEVLCKQVKDGRGWQQQRQQRQQEVDPVQEVTDPGDVGSGGRSGAVRHGTGKARRDGGSDDGNSSSGSSTSDRDNVLSQLLRSAAVAPLPGDTYMANLGGGVSADDFNPSGASRAGGGMGVGSSSDLAGDSWTKVLTGGGVVYPSARECEEALRRQAEEAQKRPLQAQPP
ncbi:hypothetical protein Vafri_13359, partial [Volvox africanus]